MILIHGFEEDLVDALKKRLPQEQFYWIGDSPKADLNIFAGIRVEQSFIDQVPIDSVVPERLIDHPDFSFFVRCYQRHWKRREFDSQELYQIYILYLRFAVGFFDRSKPKCLVFSNLPHEGLEIVLYQEAHRRGIKTLITYQSIFADRFSALESIEDLGVLHDSYTPAEKEEAKTAVSRNREALAYMAGWSGFAILRKRWFEHLRYLVGSFVKTKASLWIDFARVVSFEKWFLLLGFLSDDELKGMKYVYFPLHLQPELSTATLGGIYSDQLYALEQLAALLPKDWKIIVKENPKQTVHFRGRLFRARLAKIPNLILVGWKMNSRKLVDLCQLVATVTGTVGWEAINSEKPVVVFGQAWYRNFAGATHFNSGLDLVHVSKTSVKSEAVVESLARFLANTHHGIVDPFYSRLLPEYTDQKNQEKVIDRVILPWIQRLSQ